MRIRNQRNTCITTTTSGNFNHLKTIGAGIVIFFISILVLWFNEANTAKSAFFENYINKNCIEISATKVYRNNDNKLVFLNANAVTNDILGDIPIRKKDALALKRTVEMYQWVEKIDRKTHTRSDGTETEEEYYYYVQQWSDEPINSSHFKTGGYYNPPFTIYSKRFNAKNGKLGAFKLTEQQTSSIKELIPFTKLPIIPGYVLSDGYYYKGNYKSAPKVGDIRISFSYAPSGRNISLVGEQMPDNTIENKLTDKGSLYLQYDGKYSLTEFLEKFKEDYKDAAFKARIIGIGLMAAGLAGILSPLNLLSFSIPFLRKITGFIQFLISILGTAILSAIIIASAWFVYNPATASCIIAGAIVLLLIVIAIIQKNRRNANI